MAIKEYSSKFVNIKYMPEDGIIVLKLTSGEPSKLVDVENKIKTSLAVDSTNQDGPKSKVIKLSQTGTNKPEVVHELLQSLFAGGKEIEDAQEIAKDATEIELQGQQTSQTPQGMPSESFGLTEALNILLESTYRSGAHWDLVSQAAGMPPQQIRPETVLSLKKLYLKKKKNAFRDNILKALDKASRYFVRKLRREQGDMVAKKFKENYKKASESGKVDYFDDEKDGKDKKEKKSGSGKSKKSKSKKAKKVIPSLDFWKIYKK
jgi:hypothetical protein